MLSLDPKNKFIEVLLRLSVKRGSFKLSSGLHSDFYLDVRQTTLNSKGAFLAGSLVLNNLKPEVVGVGGLTLGADPIVASTITLGHLNKEEINGFLIRKTQKNYGAKNKIEGLDNFNKAAKVCIVEDVTTTGGSMIKAIEAARESGLDPIQCITLVDRGEGAETAIRSVGLELEKIVSLEEIKKYF